MSIDLMLFRFLTKNLFSHKIKKIYKEIEAIRESVVHAAFSGGTEHICLIKQDRIDKMAEYHARISSSFYVIFLFYIFTYFFFFIRNSFVKNFSKK